jgi:hypothetical protein
MTLFAATGKCFEDMVSEKYSPQRFEVRFEMKQGLMEAKNHGPGDQVFNVRIKPSIRR